MMRAGISLGIAAFAATLCAFPAAAHPGGLNAQGCHNNRKTGDYHCHRGPAADAPPPRPPTRQAPPLAPLPLATPVVPLPAPLPSAAARTVGVAEVLDGDTIQIDGRRIRLFGIDAMEAEQRCEGAGGGDWGCGGVATRTLAEVVEGKTIICVRRDTDAYGRMVAVCRNADGVDLAGAMVAKGLAVAYRTYSEDYVGDEMIATMASRGIWAGKFVFPETYRRGSAAPSSAAAVRSATTSDTSCGIKGNVNREGKRIYHLPSDPYYSRTKAEAMFCSEAEAAAAGFRRAGRP